MNTRRLSFAAAWPTNSASVLGRSAASTSSAWRSGAVNRSGSVTMLDPLADNADPGVAALLIDREPGGGERGIGKGADRHGDRIGKRSRTVPYRRAAFRAEVMLDRLAAVGDARPL